MPLNNNGNIIATQDCISNNYYIGTGSKIASSTTVCYKSLDIWIMFFIDFIIVLTTLLFIGKFFYSFFKKD
jgi:hypothetical protein